jgi:hypothetical protein
VAYGGGGGKCPTNVDETEDTRNKTRGLRMGGAHIKPSLLTAHLMVLASFVTALRTYLY